MSDLDPNRTPGTVIGAVAAGNVVVPFLIVYAFLFIARGIFVSVSTPDITSSRTGEAIAGFIALIFLFVIFAGMGRLLNGRGRLLFLIGQLVVAVASVWLLLDAASGEPEVPALTLIGALIAMVLAVVPTSWAWVANNGGNEPLRPAALPDDRDLAARKAMRRARGREPADGAGRDREPADTAGRDSGPDEEPSEFGVLPGQDQQR